MSKIKRCLSDIKDALGASFPRDPDNPDTVICVQAALQDKDGTYFAKDDQLIRCAVDENGDPYPSDGNGNQIITRPNEWVITTNADGALVFNQYDANGTLISGPFTETDAQVSGNATIGWTITDDSGDEIYIPPPGGVISPGGVLFPTNGVNSVVCPAGTDYTSPVTTEAYTCPPAKGTPVVHDPASDSLKGAPEHGTICANGIYIAQPASEIPWDALGPAIGGGLTDLGNATFVVDNPTCRPMTVMLLTGLHMELRINTENANRIFYQSYIDVTGDIVEGPQNLKGHIQFESGKQEAPGTGACGWYDFPALTPTTRCFTIEPEGTIELVVGSEINMPFWDGLSELAGVNNRFTLIGSTNS